MQFLQRMVLMKILIRRFQRLGLAAIMLFFMTLSFTEVSGGSLQQMDDEWRIWLRRTFPDAVAEIGKNYGLHALTKSENRQTLTVILIHGLDDPGTIWGDLIPWLEENGYRTYLFCYPNDQPIRESARFLAAELQLHHRELGKRVSMVAHSMGGLVAREMMTNPDMGYLKGVAGKAMPEIGRLIMVGTPNHGSVFARLQFISEIFEQLFKMAEGDYNLLQLFVDGMGEAAEDLYPGSAFLTELNSRQQEAKVPMLVIAGVVSPWKPDEIMVFMEYAQILMPESIGSSFASLLPPLRRAVQELGDGVVSEQSAALPGVPLIKVRANHISMIHNLLPGQARVPPAIPIILETLAEKS
jgi:pimeloyl-ACP methyl ester carboxylesterase